MYYRVRVSTPNRRGPRNAGEPDARAAILDAARDAFTEGGYSGTSLRHVSTRAGVDVGLIAYYFKTKDNLFRESVGMPIKPATLIARALETPVEELGPELVRLVLTVWNHPRAGTSMRGIVQKWVTNDDNWVGLGEFYQEMILMPLIDVLPGERPEYRASMAASTLIGLVTARYLLAIPAVREASVDDIVRQYGAQVQRWLTGPLD